MVRHVKLIDLENNCWICFSPNHFSNEDLGRIVYHEIKSDLTQKQLEFFGKTVMMPRLTAWYGDKEYNYSGTINKPREMPASIKAVRDQLEEDFSKLPGFNPGKVVLNSVLCNFYRDGSDSIDWHSDNEKGLGPDEDNVLIASVTFGYERKFVLKSKQTKQKLSFELGRGDVLIMGGKTQKFWVHKSPKTSQKIGARLNLTFRVRE